MRFDLLAAIVLAAFFLATACVGHLGDAQVAEPPLSVIERLGDEAYRVTVLEPPGDEGLAWRARLLFELRPLCDRGMVPVIGPVGPARGGGITADGACVKRDARAPKAMGVGGELEDEGVEEDDNDLHDEAET